MEALSMSVKLSENALKVLERRYLKKDKHGKVIESPQELFRRVAKTIAAVEKIYGKNESQVRDLENKFYEMLCRLNFMPNSPTLMNAGRELSQLSACFVLPIEDSMESIFDSLKATAMIHKCLDPETLVMVEGGLKKLKEVKAGERILTEEGYYGVSEVHNNGIKDIFEVITERGYAIRGTSEHRLYVVDEDGNYIWRKISQLKKGDWVVLKPGSWRGTNKRLADFRYDYTAPNSGCFKPRSIRLPDSISVQLAELWGMYIGDGCEHRDGIRFSVGAQDEELIEYISNLSLQLFDKKPSVSEYNNKSCYEVSILSITLKEWFRFLGITKRSACEVAVPEILKNTSEENICGFLRGLFSTDGCVRESGHITLRTASGILAEELQLIMLYLGIPTQKTYLSSTDSYQVSISTKSGFIKFREKIGFLMKRKQERLNAVNQDEIFLRQETIPNQKSRLKLWYEGRDILDKRQVSPLIEGIIHMPSENRQLTRQKVVIMQEDDLAADFFSQILKDNFFYCKVSTINPIGKSAVYDLTIPYKHSYIANGFVSHNSGGGTGFSFSRLRPKNSMVLSTGGIASGPVSFMKVYDAATQAVKQGGSRRGANMGILRCDHPDILEFVQCKEKDKDISNFNISVSITDDFMQKLQDGKEYDLIDPRTKKPVERLSARLVFETIVKQAHKNGEPGVIFIDRMNAFNPTPKLGAYESTNPCGEQVLLPYESCNLGSINLYRMCMRRDGSYEIDWQKLKTTVSLAVHFLDNVIDANKFPLQEIERMTRLTRKIGLGVMGWASMLCRLGIPYNSEEAIALAEEVMSFILNEARKKSEELAGYKGAFPAFKGSIFDKPQGQKLRNATLTTIAPTGTISIIAGPCSSGIEPLFAISYYRMVMDQDKLVEVDPLFEEVAKERGFYSRELMSKIAQEGCIQKITEIPEDIKRVFVVAHDITPEWHIRMQAVFQKYTDNATSKTINMPNEATVEEVAQAYQLAYTLGCKGITIYRDRSREEQVLNIERKDRAPAKESVSQGQRLLEADKIAPRPRPEVVTGTTTKVATGCGNLYVTINSDERGMPFEVFTQMGKAGGCAASQLEAIGRLVSLAFRSGIEVKSIIEQLRNIRCPSPSWEKGVRIFSCADAIVRVIEKRLTSIGALHRPTEAQAKITKAEGHLLEKNMTQDTIGVCPDCGGVLRHEEGCVKCGSCGYSKC
jgi:ribonucleoside-diphosphate reductase alpha chain